MSRHGQQEREKAVADFNDPTSPFDCLVTSMQLSAHGVNFHKACHHGVLVENGNNTSSVLQAMGRLWRLGQEFDVEWERLFVSGTFDDAIEDRNLRKYATTLAAEAGIDPQIRGTWRLVVIYYIMQLNLGHDVSRYNHACCEWYKLGAREVWEAGKFFSALGKLALEHPEICADYGEAGTQPFNYADVASRWKVGTELTVEHLRGVAPVLEDGVDIDPFPVDGDGKKSRAKSKAVDSSETTRTPTPGPDPPVTPVGRKRPRDERDTPSHYVNSIKKQRAQRFFT
jgi:hypothetical protein